MVWHEAIQGRNDEDVSSTFVKLVREPRYRHAKSITEWADNCTGQMKNWTFFCAIVAEINRGTIEVITIKYFEKGHTFMSADSFHASVERNIRQKLRTYAHPLLADVAVAQFRKGSTKLFWKNRHTDTVFQESKFMLKNTGTL